MSKTAQPRSVSAAEVVRLIKYNPKTGEVTNRMTRGRARAGQPAGYRLYDGRRMLSVRGHTALLHRWIWLYCYGYWPLVEIDHADTDWDNNKFLNLRLCVNGGVNVHNQVDAHCRSTTGLLGVHKASHGRPGFRVSINANGVRHYLGYFRDKQKAHKAYVKAKRKLHKFGTL